jgi:hypothetical protein
MIISLQNATSRFKKNSPRLTHIFYDLIDDISIELDDYQMNELVMNLKKIYTSYVFFLKAKVEVIISTTDSLTIKKLVVVGDIFS